MAAEIYRSFSPFQKAVNNPKLKKKKNPVFTWKLTFQKKSSSNNKINY